MNLKDWQTLKVITVNTNQSIDTDSFNRIIDHIDMRLTELSEVRPVLSRNPYTGEYSEDAWEASDAYANDVWEASGV